jgi:predicted ATPase with chaperone activity
MPQSVSETGIPESFLRTLLIKAMSAYGYTTVTEIAPALRLSRIIVNTLLEDVRDMALVEVLGSRGASMTAELRYALTGKGYEWAAEAMGLSQYVGPAPVPLTAFRKQVEQQKVSGERVSNEALVTAFSDLVILGDMVHRIGPAVNSGRPVLVYGAPGDGKTVIAEAIGTAFGDSIYVPHCIEVDGQIIKMFDTTMHREIGPNPGAAASERGGELLDEAKVDPRWVECKRPVIITGGELTLDMLDLMFNPISKYYEAPIQLKATGGIFVIDDFGRQRVKPQAVLNRWIIPLERNTDYLTLHTGKKFPVPFDELVVFSTNIPPKSLMDAAALRRIHYKIFISPPTEEEFTAIFEKLCRDRGVDLPGDVVRFLIQQINSRDDIELSRYQPRFIMEQVTAICDYEGAPLRIDRAIVNEAWQNLYVVE